MDTSGACSPFTVGGLRQYPPVTMIMRKEQEQSREGKMKKRDEYIQFLHKKIDDWNAEIDELMAKAEEVEADAKDEVQEKIKLLKSKRGEFEEILEKITSSGEAAWEDLKSGIDLAWEAVNEAIRSATNRFK